MKEKAYPTEVIDGTGEKGNVVGVEVSDEKGGIDLRCATTELSSRARLMCSKEWVTGWELRGEPLVCCCCCYFSDEDKDTHVEFQPYELSFFFFLFLFGSQHSILHTSLATTSITKQGNTSTLSNQQQHARLHLV